jgi:response regulator RpfG family c-di-GMP phosphodiesterase
MSLVSEPPVVASPVLLHATTTDRVALDRLHGVLRRAESAGVEPTSLLLSALARRDRGAAARARRAAEWALLLGDVLGRPDDGRTAHAVALLTDVGLLALEPAHEDTPWTAWRVRQAAHDVLAGIPALAGLAPAVLGVAEAYDGSGMPLGLAGEEIPLAARMVRVARTFDHHSGGWWPGAPTPAVTQACAVLVHAAGTALDPALVHGWLRLMDHHVAQGAA